MRSCEHVVAAYGIQHVTEGAGLPRFAKAGADVIVLTICGGKTIGLATLTNNLLAHEVARAMSAVRV